MTTYAGNPASWPTSTPLLDDAVPPTAAAFNVPLETVMDRASYLKARLGQLQALTFNSQIPSTVDLSNLKYCEATRLFMACCTDTTSHDYFVFTTEITTWPTATLVPGPASIGASIWDFDVEPTGEIVTIDLAIDNSKLRTTGNVWTNRAGEGDSTGKPNIVFEPVSGKWISAFVVTGGVGPIKVRTSTDRFVTWTNRTAPTFPAAAEVTLATNGTGRVVMQGFIGTNVYFSYSDNGGVTWSAPTISALGFTYSIAAIRRNPKPIWTGFGWVALGVNSTTNVSRVFVSVDGVTWTVASSQAANGIISIASLQDLLMGVTARGEPVHSFDNGVTWRFGEGRLITAVVPPRAVVSTGTRFVVLAHNAIFPGIGAGIGGGLVT